MSHLIEDNLVDVMTEKGKGTILRAMAVFTVIELSGSFLTGKTGPKTTRLNFLAFCQSNYMSSEYRDASELLFKIFRNGVAHSYLAQGGAILGSNPDTKNHHLKYFDRGLFIYVPQFADDVTAALRSLWKDINRDRKMMERYLSIFEQLDQLGMQIYNKFIADNNITTTSISLHGDINVEARDEDSESGIPVQQTREIVS